MLQLQLNFFVIVTACAFHSKFQHGFIIHRVIFGPERMIVVPPRTYCVIENPVVKNAEGQIQLDPSGQAKLSHADKEIRLAQDPFPLYPGEVLKEVCNKS